MALVSKAFGDIITFTRASTATYFDSAGVLQSAAIDVPRFDYDPATLAARGFLIEEARTNSIRNNTMQGAVASVARNIGTISSVSRSASATVVVAATGHTVSLGDVITVSGATPSVYNGTYSVSAVVANVSYSYVVASSATDSASGYAVSVMSPGTLPTNWAVVPSGLTQTIVGTGTSAGVTYIDIRVNGTTTSAGGIQIKPDGNAGVIAATAAQAWATSSWVAIVGGSTANTTGQRFVINEYSAGPTYLRTAVAATNILAGGATLTRVSGAITTGASTTILEPIVILDAASGAAIDITLRIGLPQLEQGAFATSVIPTTVAQVTRSADVASVNTLSPWYNATEGTLFAQANLISSSYSQGVLVDLGAGGVFGTTEYVNWSGTGWILNPNTAPINVVSSVATTSTAKVAAGLKANDSVISANGLIGTTDTSCGIVAAPTTLSIGKAGWALGNYFNGWIQRITYYPRRLSNAELQSLTV